MRPLEVGVTGALVVEGRILLVKQAYANRHGKGKGQWWVPGGYARSGETLTQAIVREMQEETGLDVDPLGILGVRTRWADVVVAFLLGNPRGELRPDGGEVEEARFFTRQQLQASDAVMGLSREFAQAALDGNHQLLKPQDFRPSGADDERYVLYL